MPSGAEGPQVLCDGLDSQLHVLVADPGKVDLDHDLPSVVIMVVHLDPIRFRGHISQVKPVADAWRLGSRFRGLTPQAQ